MNLYSKIFIVLLLLPHSALGLKETLAPQIITLSLNRTKSISISQLCDLHLSHGRSIKVIDRQHSIEILPKKIGQTLLSCGHKKYQILVLEPREFHFYNAVQKQLQSKMGLFLDYQNKEFFIRGTLLRFSDWWGLVQLAQKFSVSYHFQARIDIDLHLQVRQHFAQLAQNHHLPPPHLSFHPHLKVFFSEHSQKYKKIWTQTLLTYGLSPLFRTDLLPPSPLIRTQIWVMEVNRKWSRQWGLQWPASLNAKLTPSFKFKAPLLSALQAAEAKGKAQTLASPTLLTRSGSQAEFLAGGEFPIKIVGFRGNTRNVIWKKHGIFLKIKPVVDIEDKIRLDLKTEISTLDFSRSVEGLPSLRTNRVDTHFDLQKEQTVVISGFTQSLKGTSQSGLPWLQNLPILGALFRSQDFNENRSELMIIVQPKIIKPTNSHPSKYLSTKQLEGLNELTP